MQVQELYATKGIISVAKDCSFDQRSNNTPLDLDWLLFANVGVTLWRPR